MELKDQLSWTEFLKESSKEEKISEVKPFNRLILLAVIDKTYYTLI